MDDTTIADNGNELWRPVSRQLEGCIGMKKFLGAYLPSAHPLSGELLELWTDGMRGVPTAMMHGTTKLAAAEENIQRLDCRGGPSIMFRTSESASASTTPTRGTLRLSGKLGSTG